MALARLLGSTCARAQGAQRPAPVPAEGQRVPEVVRAIVRTRIDPRRSSRSGIASCTWSRPCTPGTRRRSSAVALWLGRRGDPLYEALVQLGQLLRTVFLADYFVNDVFRRELLRVLNRGESVNTLKRAIYTGRVANFQAKRHDELAAVGDALGLLANLVMAWNTRRCRRRSIG